MRKTTSTVLVGLLGAGSAVALSLAVPGVASAGTCAPTAVTTQDEFKQLFGTSLANDTRSHGYNVLEDGYLHVYTDGGAGVQEPKPNAPGKTQNADKVTAYYDIADGGVALASQTAQSNYKLDYNNLGGSTPPGYQLVVDLDGDSLPDGILVGEPVYKNEWWLASSNEAGRAAAPHVGGGYGSDYYGTLDEWSQKSPSAKILAFGYSLGSGVQGDFALRSITFGCNTFTFDLANRAPVAVAAVDDFHDSDYTTYWLSGTQSHDPDGDQLTYSWTLDNKVISDKSEFEYTFPKGPGSYDVTLTVSDGKLTNATTTTVKVTPPTDTIGGALPNTGANVTGIAALGAVVIAGSGAGLVATRRRGAKHAA